MRRAALVLAGALAPATTLAAPLLAPVWTDHAVIQRGQPIVVEGASEPGAQVEVTLGNQTQRVQAALDGRFTAQFAPRDASDDPLILTATDGSGTATMSDIVVGDVWLCSGQSNMEWPVSASTGGGPAAQASADSGLRLLQVPRDTAASPRRVFGSPAGWAISSPQSVPAFSAACYYMARELRKSLGVPIGAIHASWSGSQIRAWLSPESGLALYGADEMALLAGFDEDWRSAVTAFIPRWESWWREGSGGQEPWKSPDALPWQPVPSISSWDGWTGTPLASDPIGNVWFRRTLTLTPEQAAAGGTLALGVIDDMDTTWVNGQIVGNTFGWSKEREYPVVPANLRPGANEIVFAASNSYGPGGFSSTPDKLAFTVEGGEPIPLDEGWRYAIGAIREMPPRAPWDANAGIGVMHNRMIAPLGRIALEGAAWYQGEGDVGIPGYGERMRQLFDGWRRQFGPDMRVLVVQLPNFGAVAEQPLASGWAQMRDVQRQAVAVDSNAALVSAIDIGEPTDLHPPNKTVLGERLARAALGEEMPMPQRAVRNESTIVVSFSGVAGALQILSGDHVLGLELCAATQDSCRFATATAAGSELLIVPDDKPVSRVRYAWADSPVVNVFDARPLPVPGFELAVER